MIEYYQKVADLWPRYGEIDSTIVHQAIVVSLINLEMTSVCLGTYPPEKGYPCWQAMKQIQASPAFERLREKEEGVANLLDLYVARYETDAFAVAVTPKDHPRFLYADARHNESGRNRRDFLLCDLPGFHAALPGRGGYAARRKAPAFQGIPARDSVVHHRLQQAQLRNSPALIQELQTVAGEKRLEIDYQTYQKYFM